MLYNLMALLLMQILVFACAHKKNPKPLDAYAGNHTNSSSVQSSSDEGATELAEADAEASEDLSETTEGTTEDIGDVNASTDLSADEIKADRLARQTFPLVIN
jgi:hypothetical protein